MSVTPFGVDGELDEAGLRSHLKRLVDADIGVYLGSPGSGEGSSLTRRELSRLYEIGVEVCGGRVPVHGNPTESRTAQEAIEAIKIAIDAGVECVELYAFDGAHGMRPLPDEQERYYRDVLEATSYPVALSAHYSASWRPSAELIVKIADEYDQVVAVHIVGLGTGFNLEIQRAIREGVAVYGAGVRTLLQDIMVGLDGCQAAEFNICPKLARSIAADAWEGRYEQAGNSMQTILLLNQLVTKWGPGAPRWEKTALKILGLPGGDLRPPYLPLAEKDAEEMRSTLDRLGIVELEGLRTDRA
jgi:4-hydroxy-tetrahydrodipicolinate synthase